MLEAFQQPAMSNHDLESLLAHMLSVAFAQRRQEASEYILSTAEIKRALKSASDDVRTNAAWQLWRAMGDPDGRPVNKADRWRQCVGPIFEEIWPFDKALRSENVSINLVHMTLECGEAFPEAVDTVINTIVPHRVPPHRAYFCSRTRAYGSDSTIPATGAATCKFSYRPCPASDPQGPCGVSSGTPRHRPGCCIRAKLYSTFWLATPASSIGCMARSQFWSKAVQFTASSIIPAMNGGGTSERERNEALVL